MKNNYRFFGMPLVGAGCLALVALVHADYFPRSNDHALRSLKVGVGVASLPVLTRRSVGTPDTNLASLTASVLPKGYGAVSLEKRER